MIKKTTRKPGCFILLSEDTREFIHVRNCSCLFIRFCQICFCCILNPQFFTAYRTFVYLGTIKCSYIKVACGSSSKYEVFFTLIQNFIKQAESFYKVRRLIAFTNTTFTEVGFVNLSIVMSNCFRQIISIQRLGIWLLADTDSIMDMTFL